MLKLPGGNEVNRQVHTFIEEDRSHPQTEILCDVGEIIEVDDGVRVCA